MDKGTWIWWRKKSLTSQKTLYINRNSKFNNSSNASFVVLIVFLNIFSSEINRISTVTIHLSCMVSISKNSFFESAYHTYDWRLSCRKVFQSTSEMNLRSITTPWKRGLEIGGCCSSSLFVLFIFQMMKSIWIFKIVYSYDTYWSSYFS